MKKELISPAKKILVLDLDETLVHSTTKELKHYDMTVDVLIEGTRCRFYVAKRPFVDHFIQLVIYNLDMTD